MDNNKKKNTIVRKLAIPLFAKLFVRTKYFQQEITFPFPLKVNKIFLENQNLFKTSNSKEQDV